MVGAAELGEASLDQMVAAEEAAHGKWFAPQNEVERPGDTNSTEVHASSFYYKGSVGTHSHF